MSLYAVTDPATGQRIKEYPCATDAEIGYAIESADNTFRHQWRVASIADRAKLLSTVGDLHRQRCDELAEIIAREMGKPLDQARDEVEFSADIYDYYAEHASSFLGDEPIEVLNGEGTAVIRRSPVGVLLGIMPWNYPYYQVARFAAPNLAAGNTVILKHAPQCPESASAIQQIFIDSGHPEGVYTNVFATNEHVAAAIADPRIRGVSLTGSERAGSKVAEIAGRELKKVVLELGGSDPFIVLSVNDLGAAVAAAVAARLENTGQACNAAKRFIVIDEVYDDFAREFSQAILTAGKDLAPLSSVAAAENLARQVDQAVAEGATLITEGCRRGAYFPAGVLTDVPADSSLHQQELFGPVAILYRVFSEEEAIEVANATPFGLGSYVFTTDPEQADRVADRIDAGMVFVNAVGVEGVEMPFGGTKRSGFGRELGRSGIDEFVNKKLIRVP